ncbi:Nucleolin 1 [Frankliniella fusca]|uniref:Nucleolin 1 n=1 Tax=Frankliniella fusca TaxID=407009 RepID=A0AAE1H6I7_9NEOP|nr:Nucleolin 1 [Frankliniella fusca]
MDRRNWGYGGGGGGGGGGGNYRADYGNNYRNDYNDYGGNFAGNHGGYNSYNNSYGNSYNSYNNADHFTPPSNRGYGGRDSYGGYAPNGRFFPPAGPPGRMGGPAPPPQRQAARGRVDWKKRRRDNNASRETKSAAFLERKKRTLFLRNCPEKPEETLKEELKTLFAECGKVEQVTINKQELSFLPGTEKKVSIEVRIVMGTEEEAKKGLEKHGTVIEDRHLVVSRQESDFESWKTTVVCCLNISLDVDDEDLWRFFEDCGKIKNVKRVNATNGDGRLYGQVHFENEEEAQKALSLDGNELKGKPVKLRMWASLKDRPGLGVVVLNLPYGITRKEALEFMDGCGNISNLKIDSAETTNRRAVFVFWDADGVEKALLRDRQELNKQEVRVLPWDGQRLINPVFLADLPAAILEVDIWKVFQVCGIIEHVHKEMKKNNIKAYIEFQDAASIAKAGNLDGILIKGSAVKVMTDKDEWDNYPPAPATASQAGSQNGQTEQNSTSSKGGTSEESKAGESGEQANTESDANMKDEAHDGRDEVHDEAHEEANEEAPSEAHEDESHDDAQGSESNPEGSKGETSADEVKPDSEEVAEIQEGRSTRKRRAAAATPLKTPPKTRRGR